MHNSNSASIKNTVTKNAVEGIFILASDNSQIAANVQFNILKDNTNQGFSAIMTGNRNLCLALNGNNSNTGYLLQQSGGTFQVVDQDNLNTRNTGTFNFVPGVGSLVNLTACP